LPHPPPPPLCQSSANAYKGSNFLPQFLLSIVLVTSLYEVTYVSYILRTRAYHTTTQQIVLLDSFGPQLATSVSTTASSLGSLSPSGLKTTNLN
jgi:hypothetical protein